MASRFRASALTRPCCGSARAEAAGSKGSSPKKAIAGSATTAAQAAARRADLAENGRREAAACGRGELMS